MKPPVVKAMPETETMVVGKDPAEVKAVAVAEAMAMPQVMIGMTVMPVTESVSEHGAMHEKPVPVQAMTDVAERVREDYPCPVMTGGVTRESSPGRR